MGDWRRDVQEDAGYRRRKRRKDDYDYKSAREAGLGPDKTGHWPSRVPHGPKEGLILKSSRHSTFGKTVAAERAAGYRMALKRGKIYSRKAE